MGRYSQFQADCVLCGATTTKKFAREHDGKCKTCLTGVDQVRYYRCLDCGELRLTIYQKQHHYHCDTCTRETDPEGYANEVRGM